MQPLKFIFTVKKLPVLLLFFLLGFLSRDTLAQTAPDTAIENYVVYRSAADYKPFLVTGRVIGVNLEIVKGAAVINICSAQTANTDNNGIYHIDAAKGDTLAFVTPKYSFGLRGVKSQKEKLNVILIKRKTDSLPPDRSPSAYNKARKDDDELIRVLEKDAKTEGKWNY